VNTVMDLDFHNMWELSWLAEEPVVSQGKNLNHGILTNRVNINEVFVDITCGAQDAYFFAYVYQ
jgi:hypothetical protein